jgi:hypothetical protein
LDALRTFIASRRPTFIWFSSKGESAPGRPSAARQRTASAPYVASRFSGSIFALFLDLENLPLPVPASTKPEISACDQGSRPNSASARTTRENSQVRMMSWAWVHRSIGKTRSNRSGSDSHPPAISGVSDDVAQVSMTSGSPVKPPGLPRCASS